MRQRVAKRRRSSFLGVFGAGFRVWGLGPRAQHVEGSGV